MSRRTRRVGTYSATNVTVTQNVETVIATLSGVSPSGRDGRVDLFGVANVLLASDTTAMTLRIRRGTTTSGTLIGEALSSTEGLGVIQTSAVLSPAAVAANTSAEETFNVTGPTLSDHLFAVVKPTAQAGLGIVGWRKVSATQIAITFGNFTGAPITPTAAQTYRLLWSGDSSPNQVFTVAVTDTPGDVAGVSYVLTAEDTGGGGDATALNVGLFADVN